jgi:hypothetical protein
MEPQFNKFVTFVLSPEEQLVGESFHPIQIAVIQNQRAGIAQNILNLEVVDQRKFDLDHAFLKGQMAFADWLIEISNKNAEAKANPPQQPQSEMKEGDSNV